MAHDFSNSSEEWETGRETPDVLRSLQDGVQTGSGYPTDYDYSTKYERSGFDVAQQSDPPLSVAETIDVARYFVENARRGMQQSLLGSEKVGEAVKLKLTIDLSRQRIEYIPEEVVEILKRDTERLVLSHNQISNLPYRFSECTALTYLNLRGNRFKEFPKIINKLPKLQILDLSRNKLRHIPEEVIGMKALKVLSVMNNNLEAIPLSLGFLDSLKILKLAGNPLNNGLRGVLQGADISPSPLVVPIAENEKEVLLTANIKHFLKSEAAALDSGGESSESPLDTPRPLKRNTSLRFPVIPATSGSESATDLHSPGFVKPLIPVRSHYRVISGISSPQSATFRRPGASPLLLNNERNRSNSESVLQATQNTRNKRMGIITRKNSDLGIVDETRSNRNSHYRGLSHGSMLRDRHNGGTKNGINHGLSVPGSPSSGENHQGMFVRRLSSLPEHKKDSTLTNNNIIESAKGVLYCLHMVQNMLRGLLLVLRDGTTKRSSLERVYYNASTHLQRLDEELHTYESIEDSETEQRSRSVKNISSMSRACIVAYQQVGSLLGNGGSQLVDNGEIRYIRTLLLFLQGGALEGKNARFDMSVVANNAKPSKLENPINPRHRGNLPKLTVRPISPIAENYNPGRRPNGENTSNPIRNNGHIKAAMNPQSAVPLYINGRSRSNSRTNNLTTSTSSSVANTPRSGESFHIQNPPAMTSSDSPQSGPGYADQDQDAIFEKVYLSLSQSVEDGLSAIPIVNAQFVRGLELAQKKYAAQETLDLWTRLIARCRYCQDLCETLKYRLSTIKLNDPEIRNSSEFWKQYTRFTSSFVRLMEYVRETRQAQVLHIQNEIPLLLRPVYKSIKIAISGIRNSPWSYCLHGTSPPHQLVAQPQSQWQGPSHLQAQVNARLNGYNRIRGDSGSSSSPHVSVPATPLSAALGPAVQATVPSTPSSGLSLDRSFQGDVFQRADSYLNMQQTMLHRR